MEELLICNVTISVDKIKEKYVEVKVLTLFGILKNIQDIWSICHYVGQIFMNLNNANNMEDTIQMIYACKHAIVKQLLRQKTLVLYNVSITELTIWRKKI